MLWRFMYFTQVGKTNRRVTVKWIMTLAKKCIVVHICLENTWKIKQINVDGFPVRDSNWRHFESDAEFKTLLLHPQISKNTAHSELTTLSSGSGRLMYFHPRTGSESLLATQCNYRPFSLSTVSIGFNIILLPSRSYWWLFLKRLPHQNYEISRRTVSRII